MEDQKKYFKGTIPPPVIFFAFVMFSYLARRIMPVDLIFSTQTVRLLVGLPILLMSGIIAAAASMIMIKNRTAINYYKPTTKFLLTGPFRFTRNPLYLSFLLAILAMAVISNSLWHLISCVIMFFVFNFGIVAREERYLTKCFGDEYIRYKQKVRRWI